MTGENLPHILPVQVDDFTDRVSCFQNLYKDLLSAHHCAPVFESQLNVVGTAIADLAEMALLVSLFGKSTPAGQEQILLEATRIANVPAKLG